MAVRETINIIVVGECGNGKSTLIDALRDTKRSEKPMCGKNSKGVTKKIALYPCCDLAPGIAFNILDTPGVGDHDVSATGLLSMIESFLEAEAVPDGVRGVVVTIPIPDCRIRLGAQIVQAIVDKGFVAADGEDKYANIILCGTKLDRAEDEDKKNFLHGLNGEPSVKKLFFEKSGKKTGPCVMVSKKDYSPLLKAIRRLPATGIDYKKPKSGIMTAALAKKMGIEAGEMQAQKRKHQQIAKAQAAEIEDLKQKLQDQQQLRREEAARKEKMLQEARAKARKEKKQREEAQKKREEERQRVQKNRKAKEHRERRKEAKRQQDLERKLAELRAAAQKRRKELKRKREKDEARQAEQRLQMEQQQAAALAAARSGGGGGGGCGGGGGGCCIA